MATPSQPQDFQEQEIPNDRIARYDEFYDPRDGTRILQRTVKVVPVEEPVKEDGREIIVVRRIFKDNQRKPPIIKVDIKNSILLELLRELNRGVVGVNLLSDSPTVDPEVFLHSRHGITNALWEENEKQTPDIERIEVLDEVVRYISDDFGPTIMMFEHYISMRYITFELLELLFPPNSLIYQYDPLTEQDQILLARTTSYREGFDSPCFKIHCDIVTSDGEKFGLATVSIVIREFEGVSKIEDLDTYPFHYHADYPRLRERIIGRGIRYATMTGYHYGQISGQAIRETANERVERFHVNGRVVIDPVAFRLFQPDCSFNTHVHQALPRGNLTEEQLLICNPVLYGFSLSTKTWGGFAMDRLTEIDWSSDAFDLLVLGEKQKQLIRAIVKQHPRRESFDDIIAGKGKGLVGLFCGRPGCGKTLTAEAVADLYRVPLYVVTAGELGVKPDRVDRKLTDIFEVARMWNAVVLLDEAEVFLQQRNASDIKRNALVTIFLRQLEYYQGILILTTNMLEQCDAALESRIHFSIHYPDLDYDSRKKIWQTFLKKVLGPEGEFNKDDLHRLAEYTMNGRQIKNTVSSAQCIAMDEGIPLSMKHIENVMDVVSDWYTAREKLAEPALSWKGVKQHSSEGVAVGLEVPRAD
ncbi:hypothetical protein QCA50_015344 [Cerrena zonata]|uniref:AAA+ ATPase domain-containing protein n=1 Tax=Cerrena zonata TaxID=2478898 RepID=A0AAW0FLH1_9APHY